MAAMSALQLAKGRLIPRSSSYTTAAVVDFTKTCWLNVAAPAAGSAKAWHVDGDKDVVGNWAVLAVAGSATIMEERPRYCRELQVITGVSGAAAIE